MTEIEDEAVRYKSRKDTKRWCKGKVGVEHDYPEPTREKWLSFEIFRSQCTRCGRKTSVFADEKKIAVTSY